MRPSYSSQMTDQSSLGSEDSSTSSKSTSGSCCSSCRYRRSEDTITEESEGEDEEESETTDENKESARKLTDEASSKRSSVISRDPGTSAPLTGLPYSSEIRSIGDTSVETYGGLSPITEVDEDAISSDKPSESICGSEADSTSKDSEATEVTSDADSESEGNSTAL